MVPAPPDFAALPPLIHTWKRGELIVRVFNHTYPPNGFNPGEAGGVVGRFHFFPGADGRSIPVLYGSDCGDGAISETVFHDVPIEGEHRVVPEVRLDALSIIRLVPEREIRLAEMLGHGLRRYQLRPEDLTSTEPDQYARTIPWAQALHATVREIDGIVWMSRQFNAARALVLFGDRVSSIDLAVQSMPLPLRIGPGRVLVDRAANQADIAIV